MTFSFSPFSMHICLTYKHNRDECLFYFYYLIFKSLTYAVRKIYILFNRNHKSIVCLQGNHTIGEGVCVWLPAGYKRFVLCLPCGWCIASSRHTHCLDESCSTVFFWMLFKETFSLGQKGIGPPLLVHNGITVSLLIRHCAVFLDRCHGKCVNDLVLEMNRIFPLCLY